MAAETTPTLAGSSEGESASSLQELQKAESWEARPVEEGSFEGALSLRELFGLGRRRRRAAVAVFAIGGVEVGVADAGDRGDGDARAELAALAGDGGERGDVQRFFGLQNGRLARVAFGVGVGDVGAGDVDRVLLGDQAGEGGLESLEGGDGHGERLRLRREVEHAQRAVASGTRAGGGGAAGVVAMHAGVERQRLHEVVEEGELDLHQRAVAGVFAAELLEQAAQLRGALGGKLRAGGVEQHREPA